MRDFVAGLIVGLVALVLAGYGCIQAGRDIEQREAVKACAAQYYLDGHYARQFRYITNR